MSPFMARLRHAAKFKTNTLIIEQKAAAADPANYENPAGPFSAENNSIPALMRRGVVFMCCHNAIWEQAAALIKADVNSDKLSHSALAAELTKLRLREHDPDHAVHKPGWWDDGARPRQVMTKPSWQRERAWTEYGIWPRQAVRWTSQNL
jgi:hypothetical protein